MPQRAKLPDLSVVERSRKDPTFLELDPASLEEGRHYHWVRCRADEYHMAVTKAKIKGYRVETFRDGGPKPLTESEMRPDKIIAVGDLILMSCPKEKFEEREQNAHARTEALIASTSAQTEEMAREKGIAVIKDPGHNI